MRKNCLIVLVLCLLMMVAACGCAPKPAAAPPPGIRYEIGQGAELSKVTWYPAQSDLGAVLGIDIEIANVSSATKKFDVGVKADDEPFVFAALDATKEVKAGQKATYKLLSTVNTPYLKRLVIRVVAS